MSVFEDQEGNIWVGTATTGVNRFQRKPLPFKRYRHEPGNPQSLLRTSVTSVYADSQENIWVGSGLGVTRIDGKTGKYSFFRNAGSAPANLPASDLNRRGSFRPRVVRHVWRVVPLRSADWEVRRFPA